MAPHLFSFFLPFFLRRCPAGHPWNAVSLSLPLQVMEITNVLEASGRNCCIPRASLAGCYGAVLLFSVVASKVRNGDAMSGIRNGTGRREARKGTFRHWSRFWCRRRNSSNVARGGAVRYCTLMSDWPKQVRGNPSFIFCQAEFGLGGGGGRQGIFRFLPHLFARFAAPTEQSVEETMPA